MTAIDREAIRALIFRQAADGDWTVDQFIDRLLALVPEPAEDEREEAILLVRDGSWEDGQGWNLSGSLAAQIVDRFLAAGFTRRPLPSREQIAKALFEHYRSTHRETYPWSRQSIVTHRMYLSEADAILALFTPGGDS